MGEADKKENKKERRFSQEQYESLKKCSEGGEEGIKKWNEWREKHRDEDICLEGADLSGLYLEGAFLNKAAVIDNNGVIYSFPSKSGQKYKVLENATYKGLLRDELDHVDYKKFGGGVYLRESNLRGAHLEGALFFEADLEEANLSDAHLEGTDLWHADLRGAQFHTSIVDGSTVLWRCKISRETNFRGVGLDSTCIDSGTKQLLKYNVRRLNWEDWYKEHWFWRWPVQVFWWMSDYGMSTVRVVGVFFLLAFLFAAVYMNWGYWRPPGIVSNLVVQPEIGEAVLHYFGRALIRPVYFSIVTMTTLGFGDMYANKGSIAGHVILAVQVILGYVLLGALITRFAVLFTAGGPAGKFAKSRKSPD